jgi:NADH/NAD ratio-sensing transcriptional regulator Rex
MRQGDTACAVYECVRGREIAGCYECVESPCALGDWPPARCPLRGRFGGGERWGGFQERLEVTKGVAAEPQPGADFSEAKARRVRGYVHVVEEYRSRDVSAVSSHHLARAVGVRASLVRRDLSGLGHFGTPGRGYDVELLGAALRRCLRLDLTRATIWVGDWRMAAAPETRQALERMNCRLVGVFDNGGVGEKVDGAGVMALARAPGVAKRRRARVAVLAAEEAAERAAVQELADAGIGAVLNLTPRRLEASAKLVIEQGDLGSQLFRLLVRLGSSAEGSGGRA